MEKTSFLTKCNAYLSYLFVISLPLYIKSTSIIIIIWILCFIIRLIKEVKVKFTFALPQKILLAFYLLYIIGYFFSENKHAALFSLEVKLSLLVFPLLIASDTLFFKKYFNRILLFFVAGVAFSALFCFFKSVWLSTFFTSNGIVFNAVDPQYYFWTYGGNRFRYLGLSYLLHPTYFSVYILFALVISVHFLNSDIFKNKYLLLSFKILIPFFILMIYLLSSKAVIVTTLFVLVIFSILFFKKINNVLVKIVSIITILVLIYIALDNPRFVAIKQTINNPAAVFDNSKDGSFVSRIHIWKAAINIIKQNFLFGVGPGDTNSELTDMYEKFNYKAPVFRKSNAHNQYLETFIDTGILGFLFLIVLLFLPFFIRSKNAFVFSLFLFIMAFNFLFESMLNTRAGVIFFGFFYSLLSSADYNRLKFRLKPRYKRGVKKL